MATKGKVARNEHRKAVVARHAERRAELKAVIAGPATPEAERAAARRELDRQPRDASATRVRNRDAVTGAHEASCASSGCRGCAYVGSRTRVTCRGCARPAGDGSPFPGPGSGV